MPTISQTALETRLFQHQHHILFIHSLAALLRLHVNSTNAAQHPLSSRVSSDRVASPDPAVPTYQNHAPWWSAGQIDPGVTRNLPDTIYTH